MLTTIPEVNPTVLLYAPYNYSYKALAELLGVSSHTIKAWVAKRIPPTPPTCKLAALLKQQLDQQTA